MHTHTATISTGDKNYILARKSTETLKKCEWPQSTFKLYFVDCFILSVCVCVRPGLLHASVLSPSYALSLREEMKKKLHKFGRKATHDNHIEDLSYREQQTKKLLN